MAKGQEGGIHISVVVSELNLKMPNVCNTI